LFIVTNIIHTILQLVKGFETPIFEQFQTAKQEA
jgi:hypothetical protein